MNALMRLAEWFGKYQHYTTPMLVMVVLTMFLVPVPVLMLDLMIASNFTISLLILLTVMYMPKPLAFSSFPSTLLLSTLFRLSLNVASTRIILLYGHEGTDAAGEVIQSFGQFVAGGEFIIGIIIFSIIIIIQFVVINAGSSRIAEVTARFTLDALPGKQMSIDADLNSGLIDETEAKRRRIELQEEADFFGAMDGAIKFVSKDAIASMLIVGINIIGGILFGIFRHGMAAGEAASTFIILTIGDGLVSALPSLFISVAGGILTTRATAKRTLGQDVLGQIFSDQKPIGFAAVALGMFGLIPGLPTIPFLLMALFLGSTAVYLKQTEPEREGVAALGPGRMDAAHALPEGKGGAPAALAASQENVEALLKVDMMGLEIGYGLISLVNAKQGGNVLERIKSIRKQMAMELGIIVPPVRIRDNLQLRPNQYQVLIKGTAVAGGDLLPNHFLAMNPGTATVEIDGIPTKEPAFGLDAFWIKDEDKDKASLSGYTVVDLQTVVATHLGEVIKSHAASLLGRQEVQNLIQNLADTFPKIVEDLIPGILPLGVVQKVLQNLLQERVSIRDLLSVLEALAETGLSTKDPTLLTEMVRQRVGRAIVSPLLDEQGHLQVLSLGGKMDRQLHEALQTQDHQVYLAPDPQLAQQFFDQLQVAIAQSLFTTQPVLLVGGNLRQPLFQLLQRFFPSLMVLSHQEVPLDIQVQTIGVVGE
jgi:flagellar biosynthesis protein FlhA